MPVSVSVSVSVLIPVISVSINAKQKHLECKKVQGQSEATLQTGRCDQKL